jgi:uncharacterized repeat protein (TIGR01451 family)
MQEYDPATNTWTGRASLNQPRADFATAVLDGKIYVIGGRSGYYSYLTSVEVYDPATDTWTYCSNIPTYRYGLAAASFDGKIYAIGGYNGGFLSTVEEYDPITNTWTNRTSMNTARRNMAVAALNGKIYAIGGYNGNDLSTIEEYDPLSDAWKELASLPTSRDSLAVAALHGKIYAIGGNSDWDPLSTVEEYNPTTDTWRQVSSISTARHGLAAAELDGKIYAVGGSYSSLLEEYTPPISDWVVRLDRLTISGGLGLPIQALVNESQVTGTIQAGAGSEVILTTSNGGIDLTTGQVLSSTVRGTGINIGPGSTVRNTNVENATDWGINASGIITLTHSRIVGCNQGVNLSGGVAEDNLIANSTYTGLQIDSGVVLSNTITGNRGNSIVIVGGAPTILGNNLEGNYGTYDLDNTTANSIDATGNWWGTPDSSLIKYRLHDKGDDLMLGKVDFIPVLATPNQDGPAYVRTVTVTPNPVGIDTAVLDIQFSREMNTSQNPKIHAVLNSSTSWYTLANMPTARSGLASVTLNGKIYAIGGYDGSYLSTVEEYDPATNAWGQRTSMPTARAYLAAAVINGKIYAIGGETNYGSTAVVEVYDPSLNSWSTRASLPNARSGLAASALNGKILVMGGRLDGDYLSDYLSSVEQYDPTTNTWMQRANLSSGRAYLGSAVMNGKVYAVGGWPYSDFEKYDPALDAWTPIAGWLTARGYLAATALNGKIYAIGGLDQLGERNVVKEYDPITNIWKEADSLPAPRQGLSAVALNGRLFAIGGWNHEQLATNSYYQPNSIPLVFEDLSWLSPESVEAQSEVTSLIARGIYSISVQDVSGTDGIMIAPNTNFTFTVDYTNTLSDTTPPYTPIVTACASVDLGTLSATWSAFDPETQITLYRYAIGSVPDGIEIVPWSTTQANSFLRNDLGLIAGQTYYISVQARNEGGLWSEVAAAPGVMAGSGLCRSTLSKLYIPLSYNTFAWTRANPPLKVKKFHNPINPLPGDIVTYTLMITNVTDKLIKPVYITDDLLSNLTYISYSIPTSVGSYNYTWVSATRNFWQFLDGMAAGQHNTIIMRTRIPSSAANGSQIKNRISAGPYTIGSHWTTNYYDDLDRTFVLSPTTTMSITLGVNPSSGCGGQNITFNISVTNNGTVNAQNVRGKDTFNYAFLDILNYKIPNGASADLNTTDKSIIVKIPILSPKNTVNIEIEVNTSKANTPSRDATIYHYSNLTCDNCIGWSSDFQKFIVFGKHRWFCIGDDWTFIPWLVKKWSYLDTPMPTPTENPYPSPILPRTATVTPVKTGTITPATETPTPTETGTATNTPLASGGIGINKIVYRGNASNQADTYVEIRNDDISSIQLQGWVLRNNLGTPTYTFPSFVMVPGKVCRIYTNEVHTDTCGFTFSSSSPIWDSAADCAYLFDSGNLLVGQKCYP